MLAAAADVSVANGGLAVELMDSPFPWSEDFGWFGASYPEEGTSYFTSLLEDSDGVRKSRKNVTARLRTAAYGVSVTVSIVLTLSLADGPVCMKVQCSLGSAVGRRAHRCIPRPTTFQTSSFQLEWNSGPI